MRLCDIIDIKSAFMEKTDLSEKEIQTIIDDIPTAYDVDDVVAQLKKCYGIFASPSQDYAAGLKEAYERAIGIVTTKKRVSGCKRSDI